MTITWTSIFKFITGFRLRTKKKAFHIGYPVVGRRADGHVTTKILRCMNNQSFLPILLRTLRTRESSTKKHLKNGSKGKGAEGWELPSLGQAQLLLLSFF